MTNKNQRRLIKKKSHAQLGAPFLFHFLCLVFSHFPRVESTLMSPSDAAPPIPDRMWRSVSKLYTPFSGSQSYQENRKRWSWCSPSVPELQFFALQVPHPDASLTGFVSFQYPYILGFWVSHIPFGPVLRTLPIRELAAGTFVRWCL